MTSKTPGPRGLGTYVKYLGAVRAPHLLFQDLAKRHGDFVKLPAGPKKTYLLSHPDHVREVLVDGARSVSKGHGAAASARMLGAGLLTTAGVRHDADRAVVEPTLDPDRISKLGDTALMEAIDRRRADPGPWIVGDLVARGGMSDRQIRDQLVQLYGGHRPARVAQSWGMYLLAKNLDVQERLAEEIATVLGDRLPDGDDYSKLPYTKKVWSEILRFYPPVWILTRRVNKDLPVSGGMLPVGSILFVSEYVIHHDARWYPDPERFDSERFSEEAVAGRHDFAFFPFGAGIRGCVGSPFADLEGALLLATIVQRWRISTVPGSEPEPLMRVNIKPKRGVVLRLTRRKEVRAG